MSYGLWLSAAGMQVNEYRQALSANNMANVDTVGFKSSLAVIHERNVESVADPQQRPFSDTLLDAQTGGAWVKPTYIDFSQGGLENTGSEHDMAIFGDGFFTVTDGDQTRYTRDGRFTVDSTTGELLMVAGEGKYKVLSDAGNSITISDPSIGPTRVAKDGTIYQGNATIGRLGIVDFSDRSELRPAGDNTFEYLGSSQPGAANGEVLGGYVERSTVNPTESLIDVIEVSRAYELNARMLSLQDETMGMAVQRIGRIA